MVELRWLHIGWIAYRQDGNSGQPQVWTRSLGGEIRQRSIFGTASLIEALNDEGEVIFVNQGRKFLSKPDGSITVLDYYLGQAFPVESQWFLTVGGGLFELNTQIPSVLLYTAMHPKGVNLLLDFGVDSEAGVIVFEMSTDFQDWTPISTNAMSDGLSIVRSANAFTGSRAFFRARGER